MAISNIPSIGNCNCYAGSPVQYFQSYTGIKFLYKNKNNQCEVFIPKYKNLFNKKSNLDINRTEMVMKDEYTSNTILINGSSETIDSVTLKDLWEYAENNILWDEFTETLSFKDAEVEEITLYDFIKDIDKFLVYNKLTKFGNIWWVGKVSTDLEGEESRNINVSISNNPSFAFNGSSDTLVKFWSPDKYINDEYKKYIKDPIFYSGFLVDQDFSNNGWFSIPDMKISTKPFEKLKIAQILLNINFAFEPKILGDYYTIDSTLGTRIKDETSQSILDVSQTKGNQNSGTYADTILNHWVGGLVSTDNLQSLGTIGKYKNANCDVVNITSEKQISHSIAAQISLNTETDSRSKELLNTIDPINWRSTNSNINPHNIQILNIDRAFGGASGDSTNATVFGGITKSNNDSPRVIDTIEIWNNTGFMTNTVTSASSPRCFHLQGGQNSKAAVVMGGYSDFNYNSVSQFSQYAKSNVMDNAEVFIKSDNPLISYFRQLKTIKLSSPRGEGSGILSVSVQDRKGKFEVKNELQTYTTSKEDEQRILEYVSANSGESSDSKRYTIMNIEGFYYGGSRTGNMFLISKATTNEILDTFERVSIIYAGVANTESYETKNFEPEVIVENLPINCKDENGAVVDIPVCGKYRIKYLTGAGRAGG